MCGEGIWCGYVLYLMPFHLYLTRCQMYLMCVRACGACDPYFMRLNLNSGCCWRRLRLGVGRPAAVVGACLSLNTATAAARSARGESGGVHKRGTRHEYRCLSNVRAHTQREMWVPAPPRAATQCALRRERLWQHIERCACILHPRLNGNAPIINFSSPAPYAFICAQHMLTCFSNHVRSPLYSKTSMPPPRQLLPSRPKPISPTQAPPLR
jgi:hypothetical protein